jgi:hypothetical protein
VPLAGAAAAWFDWRVATPSPSAADIAEAHRQLLADGDIQTRLVEPPAPEPPPDWLAWLKPLLPYLQYIGWAVLAVAALLLLWRIWRWWQARQAGAVVGAEAPGWRPDAAQARELLAEADALAAAGEFGAAAHLILLKSVEQIARRHPQMVRPALTSRGIAALAGLTGPAAGAFAVIAGRVERWLFAGRRLEDADWQQCRQAYAAVAG